MMGSVHDSGLRGRFAASGQGAGGDATGTEPADDWLADVGEVDWSETAGGGARPRTTTPAYQGLSTERDDVVWPDRSWSATGADAEAEAAAHHRAVVERRRIVAALVLVVLLGAAIIVPVLLLRGGDDEPAPTQTAGSTTPTQTGETTTPTTTPGTTTPATTTPATTTPTTPATTPAEAFELPATGSLRPGSEETAAVTEVQQILTDLGYDPGGVDGIYGPQTEAAVVAFQQANDLETDGIVGTLTTAALNEALAAQATGTG
jgi:murein L,D-transpeptidase YcbB/YkuD